MDEDIIWDIVQNHVPPLLAQVRAMLSERNGLVASTKRRAAIRWCENGAALTGTPWRYSKVGQKDFEKLQATEFVDLLLLEITSAML